MISRTIEVKKATLASSGVQSPSASQSSTSGSMWSVCDEFEDLRQKHIFQLEANMRKYEENEELLGLFAESKVLPSNA